MEKRTSGFVLALSGVLTFYFAVMAGWVEEGAASPADHAAAKVLGVVAGGLAIAVMFQFARWTTWFDSATMPGYVPLDRDGNETP